MVRDCLRCGQPQWMGKYEINMRGEAKGLEDDS